MARASLMRLTGVQWDRTKQSSPPAGPSSFLNLALRVSDMLRRLLATPPPVPPKSVPPAAAVQPGSGCSSSF